MAQPLLLECFLRLQLPEAARTYVNGDTVGDTLYFTSMPSNIGSGKSTAISSTSVLGKAEPYRTFGASTGRSWSLDLQFFAEEDAKKEVVDKLNWCESLQYPVWHGSDVFGPPIIHFVFGSFLNVNCLCKNVSSTIGGPWDVELAENIVLNPSDPGDKGTFNITYPMAATVNIVLDELGDGNIGYAEARRGKHNGGY